MNKIKISLIASAMLSSLYVSNVNASEISPFIKAQNMSIKEFKKSETQSNKVFRIVVSSKEDLSNNLNILEDVYSLTGAILKYERNLIGDFHIYYVNSIIDSKELVKQISDLELFDTVEADLIVRSPSKMTESYNQVNRVNKASTNDPLYATQVYMEQPESTDNPTGHLGVQDLERALTLTQRNHPVRVGIIDTGSMQHEDLEIINGYKFSQSQGERGGNFSDVSYGFDDDGNIDSICYDGHGSAVASLLGAKRNNSLGMAGTVEGVEIVMARAMDMDCESFYESGGTDDIASRFSSGTTVDIADSMLWLAGLSINNVPDLQGERVDVINMSLGGFDATGCTSYLQQVIDIVNAEGTIITTSAGNENRDVQQSYPAGCRNVIVVGSNTLDGNKSQFSSFGNNVDITGYGEYLTVVDPILDQLPVPDEYIVRDINATPQEGISGTSFSVVHATSTVAMLRQTHGDIITVDLAEHFMKSTAVEHNQSPPVQSADCTSGRCGAGILQSYETLRMARAFLSHDSNASNAFSGDLTCEENQRLEALDNFINVCGRFDVEITNNNEYPDTYYELLETELADSSFDKGTVIYQTTTDTQDRTISTENINIEERIYGVRACDSNRCYPVVEVTFDLSTLPQFCQ